MHRRASIKDVLEALGVPHTEVHAIRAPDGPRDFSHILAPFTRCIRCNGLLRDVDKALVLDQLEPRTKLYYEEFSRCIRCGRVYWRGSHYERMREHLARAGLSGGPEAGQTLGSS